LYVNGCSHSAAAEAAVPHAWACDDGELWQCGDEPHPANLAVSYGRHIADSLGAELICEASSGGSNDRVIRTTTEWIKNNPDKLDDTFIILQWTTWEREEWFYQDRYWQVNASGIDTVPAALEERYKNYVINVDWAIKTLQAHDKIWNMHLYLKELKIKHLFFSGHSTFSDVQNKYNWGKNYIGPYDISQTYNSVLINNGFKMVNPATYHFRADAHCFWAEYLLQYINENALL
jgi:ABC-type nitrate/sulfonate/bicarbonate transport system substrate-binding protein